MALREGPGATECKRLGRVAEALHAALLSSAPPPPGEDTGGGMKFIFPLLIVGISFGQTLDIKQLERDRVVKAADAYLNEQPVTITASKNPRSAGGLHDFSSEADYWWPSTTNPSGPYVQRDGMTN